MCDAVLVALSHQRFSIWLGRTGASFNLAGQDGRVVLKRKSVYAGLNHRRPVCDCPSVQPELNAELNAMSDDEFAAIIGRDRVGKAGGRSRR